MKKLFFSCVLFALGAWNVMAQTEKPMLTMACLSDSHSELSMISSASEYDVKLRPCLVNALNAIGKTEKIDVLLLGGDYTSDVSISEKNWWMHRNKLTKATLAAFPKGSHNTPVIYVTGNHDYEVANYDKLPKSYNSADYYTSPMKAQIGELDPEECCWEMAANGDLDSMRLLSAYHYQIAGFDFVVHNCAKYFFASAWDYHDSKESVEWVARKLDEIDPTGTKTIFYLNHLPITGTIGATSDKTLKHCEATEMLLRALSRHKGLVYLYGHDHSSHENMSYITDDVRQRVTHHDTNGDLYGQTVKALLRSAADTTKYLGLNGNLNPVTKNQAPTFTITTHGALYHPDSLITTLRARTLERGKDYVHCNYKGAFSFEAYNSEFEELYAYEIDALNKGTRVSHLEYGKKYSFVGKDKDAKFYVMKNVGTSASGEDARMARLAITGGLPADGYKFLASYQWVLEKPYSLDEKPGESSFTSCFMGSMRYNSLETNATPGVSDSPIVQALIVKVYEDRIDLEMRNYGQTGQLSGAAISPKISESLKSYSIKR